MSAPNSPERRREVSEWMARQNTAAVAALAKAVSDPQIRLRTKIFDALNKLDRPDVQGKEA